VVDQRQAVLGRASPEVVVAVLDELPAALEHGAVGHGAGPGAPAHAISRLEDADIDARSGEVDGAGQAGEAGAHHCDLHA
jgi:hypothetical protein